MATLPPNLRYICSALEVIRRKRMPLLARDVKEVVDSLCDSDKRTLACVVTQVLEQDHLPGILGLLDSCALLELQGDLAALCSMILVFNELGQRGITPFEVLRSEVFPDNEYAGNTTHVPESVAYLRPYVVRYEFVNSETGVDRALSTLSGADLVLLHILAARLQSKSEYKEIVRPWLESVDWEQVPEACIVYFVTMLLDELELSFD